MKNIRNILLYIAAAGFFTMISCSKEGNYTLTETAPLDFKTYYNGLDVTFVNTASDAQDVSWNFGDNTPDVAGDSVVHTFAQIGNYVISLNATVQGKPYVFHTILRVDKAALVDMNDGTFDDWNNVTYPDFLLSGKGAIDTAKVDYDANYVYVYVEFDTVEANTGRFDHIFGVYMDVDNSVATGFSMKEMGVDYAVEGNLFGGWFGPSMVDMINGDPGWPFMGFDNENAVLPGYMTKEGNTVKMEFGISREVFKINSDAMSFSMSIMNADWSDVGNLVTPLPEFSEKIPVMMNKSGK
jgi:hypothetical protein